MDFHALPAQGLAVKQSPQSLFHHILGKNCATVWTWMEANAFLVFQVAAAEVLHLVCPLTWAFLLTVSSYLQHHLIPTWLSNDCTENLPKATLVALGDSWGINQRCHTQTQTCWLARTSCTSVAWVLCECGAHSQTFLLQWGRSLVSALRLVGWRGWVAPVWRECCASVVHTLKHSFCSEAAHLFQLSTKSKNTPYISFIQMILGAEGQSVINVHRNMYAEVKCTLLRKRKSQTRVQACLPEQCNRNCW
jgi:hypothetical protein